MADHDLVEFERWQTRFGEDEYAFGEEPNAFLASWRSMLPASGKALSVADGEGRNGVWLAEQGLDVDSFDFSPHGVRKARALAQKRNVALNVAEVDIGEYPWPAETYDVVVAVFIQFMWPEQRAAAFVGMRRSLKKGGLLLMEGYTPKQLEYETGGPKEPEKLYTRALLEEAFQGLASLEIREYEAELDEGTSHRGVSALISLAARKS